MAKKKKAGIKVFTWIMIAFMAVGLVLTVVGIFTDWTTTKGEAIGGIVSTEGNTTLQDYFDQQKDSVELLGEEKGKIEYFDATYAFAWIALIGSAVALAGYLLGGLLRLNLFKTIGMLGGIVALLTGVLTAIFTYMMCKELSADAGIVGSVTTTLAVGCYLTMIGGIVSGGSAIVAKLKK